MPKRDKKVLENSLPELDEKLEELVSAIPDDEPAADDSKREELIKASEDGYITEKISSIKKASEKTLDKIHTRYMTKRKKDADAFLTDMMISQFASMLGGLDAIESPEGLANELKTNTLLKKDIENLVSVVSPYIPIIGFISGGATTGKHIYQWKTKPSKDNPPLAKDHPTTAL